jgi:hypothetical protein
VFQHENSSNKGGAFIGKEKQLTNLGIVNAAPNLDGAIHIAIMQRCLLLIHKPTSFELPGSKNFMSVLEVIFLP